MFFRNNDDDTDDSDDSGWTLEEAHAGGDATIGDVTVETGDTTGEAQWFQSFDIDVEGGSGGSASGPVPQPSPSPKGDQYSRGTFVFPNDDQFMQSIEICGRNGHGNPVETVYVLTGRSETVPDRLFALHEPGFYKSATRTSVVSYGRKMAKKIARTFPDGEEPGIIARFHTHPSGNVQPSDTDRGSAEAVHQHFRKVFDRAEFEFFQGIHGYRSLSSPRDGRRREATAHTNGVSWEGESYRHELALFGPKFKNPKSVEVINGPRP